MLSVHGKRTWLVGGAIAVVLVAVAGWFFVISPEMSSTSSLRSDASSAEWDNTLIQAKLTKLKNESANLGALTASLQKAMAALPADSGLPALTRQLSSQAAANSVSLTSIAVGTVTAISATGAAATSVSAVGGLYSIPVTLVSTGSLSNQLSFLKAVQVEGPRRALVTSTQIAPPSGAKVASIEGLATFTTQLTVFSAPQTPQQVAQLEKLLHGNIAN